MPQLLPCPECGQDIWMLQLVPAVERHDQDAYRCPVCRSLWYEDELKKLNEHALRPYWQDELPPEGDDDLG